MESEKGQSLVEVIVAVTVGILVVTALTFATIFSLRNANFSKNAVLATKLAQEGLEKVRTLRDRDGDVRYIKPDGTQTAKFSDLWPLDLSCPVSCYFYFNTAGGLIGGTAVNAEPLPPHFQRQFEIENEGTDRKKVAVIVKWTDPSGPHESKLTTILRKL